MRRLLLLAGVIILLAPNAPAIDTTPDVREILTRMANAYAGASTYSDHGAVIDPAETSTDRALKNVLQGSDRATFTTEFRRNGGTAFVFHPSYFKDESAIGKPGSPQFERDSQALAGATRGASRLTLRLLMPQAYGWTVAMLDDPRIGPSARVHDRDCYVVSGHHGEVRYALSIDMQTFLLQRVETAPITVNGYVSRIDYWPASR